MPALGCGLGGLAWQDVRRVIDQTMGEIPGVRVTVYKPYRVVLSSQSVM